MAIFQKTIQHQVSCNGIGLHSGKEVKMTLLPAPDNQGIIFKRTDITDKNNIIKANYENVTQTNLGTVISNKDGVYVSTVEHFMAALWCLNVDNLTIEIDNVELPILDGSSEPFIFLLECAGSQISSTTRKVIEILKEFEVQDGDKFLKVKPALDFSIKLKIDFNHPQIQATKFHFSEHRCSFKSDVSRARTFCFKSEIDQMHQMGLAKGGSLDNAIVVDDHGILNEGPLRYPDEFVKHKILDFIGDIYLAGHKIRGEFEAFKTGHSVNNKFLRKLFADETAWRLVNY